MDTSRTAESDTSTQTGPNFTIVVNFLRRNASGQLALVQSVALHESKTYGYSSFASGPNKSVLCTIYGSNTVHEIFRESAAAAAPFAEISKTHRLPDAVQFICELQCVGEQRLVSSFADRSVRVFRLIDGALSEIQRLTAPEAVVDWEPETLVGLPNGGLCIRTHFTDPTDSTGKFGIDFCAADTSGILSAPRRLLQFTNGGAVSCNLCASDASNSFHRFIFTENSNLTTVALRVFLFKQDLT